MTEMESTIYFYAFRYCLGRMTYAVDDFCREATAKIGEIGTHELKLMEKEITDAEMWDAENEELRKKYAGCARLGMDCDRVAWMKFRETVRIELERRKNMENKEK